MQLKDFIHNDFISFSLETSESPGSNGKYFLFLVRLPCVRSFLNRFEPQPLICLVLLLDLSVLARSLHPRLVNDMLQKCASSSSFALKTRLKASQARPSTESQSRSRKSELQREPVSSGNESIRVMCRFRSAFSRLLVSLICFSVPRVTQKSDRVESFASTLTEMTVLDLLTLSSELT